MRFALILALWQITQVTCWKILYCCFRTFRALHVIIANQIPRKSGFKVSQMILSIDSRNCVIESKSLKKYIVCTSFKCSHCTMGAVAKTGGAAAAAAEKLFPRLCQQSLN